MSLVVGINSYVTLEEAEEILKSNYISTSEVLIKWNTLSDSDKEVLLNTSRRDIDSLKFDGARAEVGQRLEFPRVNRNIAGYGYRLFISQYADNGLISGSDSVDGGLSLVKEAQCENAIWACYLQEKVTTQIGINISGLTSKSAGPIKETYNLKTRQNEDASRGIYTDKVYSILTPWLCDARASV